MLRLRLVSILQQQYLRLTISSSFYLSRVINARLKCDYSSSAPSLYSKESSKEHKSQGEGNESHGTSDDDHSSKYTKPYPANSLETQLSQFWNEENKSTEERYKPHLVSKSNATRLRDDRINATRMRNDKIRQQQLQGEDDRQQNEAMVATQVSD